MTPATVVTGILLFLGLSLVVRNLAHVETYTGPLARDSSLIAEAEARKNPQENRPSSTKKRACFYRNGAWPD